MEAWHVNTLFSSLPLLPPESGAVEDAEFRTFITFLRCSYFLFQRKLRDEDTKIPDELDYPKLRVEDTLVRKFTLDHPEIFYYSNVAIVN